MNHITEDVFYKNFITAKPNATESTIKNYNKTLKKFCIATGTTLEKAVMKCKNQQDKIIEKTIHIGNDTDGNQIVEKTVSKFNVNNIDSYIKLYFDTYINYCKNKGNKNTTINLELIIIKAFFNYYNVKTPSLETLENDANKWDLLTKEDIKYVMSDSILMHETLISFLKSTGMRLSDALNKTLGEFLEETKDYHNYINVEEFVDNAPQNMIATCEFYPQKTRRHNIKCITFIDPETCNLILQLFRKLKNESLPLINKKYDTDYKLTKDTPLFGSKRYYFQKAVTPRAVTNSFLKKNNKFREYKISLIKEAIEKGELSNEDFEKEVNKIPRFHAHALRKFFETTIARNCGDLRICALLEGHKPPMVTDNHYIKIDSAQVKEVYLSALEDLSIENTDVKVYTSEVRREMESKIKELEDKNQRMESELSEITDIKARLSRLEDSHDDDLLSGLIK